jgi:hypothetical protein
MVEARFRLGSTVAKAELGSNQAVHVQAEICTEAYGGGYRKVEVSRESLVVGVASVSGRG